MEDRGPLDVIQHLNSIPSAQPEDINSNQGFEESASQFPNMFSGVQRTRRTWEGTRVV